jgi:hypothetical protein
MKKITKLRICDVALLALTLIMLVSGIQLEADPRGERLWVWCHIALGSLYVGFLLWHISLHRRAGGPRRPAKMPISRLNRWLGVFFALMLISAIVATSHWIGSYVHATPGGIHGKIGFVFLLIGFIHLRKNFRFYKSIVR